MPPELRRIARRQGGCFTKRQASQLGMSASEIQQRLDGGDWRIVMGDVIVVSGAPVTDEMMAWTAVLTVGRPVALAGKFAGAWLKLDGCPSWLRPALVIPESRGQVLRPGIDIRRTRGPWRVVEWRGLPVTPIPVTIRDAAVDSPHGAVRDVVQHALRRRRTSFEALAATLGRGIPGAATLRSVLEEVGPGYQSLWERRLHLALRHAGIQMQPQVEVKSADGRSAFLDMGIRRLKYGVEVDGFLNHMKRFAADRRRARRLANEMEWHIDSFAVQELNDDMPGAVREIAATVTRLEAESRRTA